MIDSLLRVELDIGRDGILGAKPVAGRRAVRDAGRTRCFRCLGRDRGRNGRGGCRCSRLCRGGCRNFRRGGRFGCWFGLRRRWSGFGRGGLLHGFLCSLLGLGRSFSVAAFEMRLRARPPFRFLRMRRAMLGASSCRFSASFGDRAGNAFGLFLCEDFFV